MTLHFSDFVAAIGIVFRKQVYSIFILISYNFAQLLLKSNQPGGGVTWVRYGGPALLSA